MTPLLFVCTTCDRYAVPAETPTRGERMLAAVQAEAERLGVARSVCAVACVNSCPRPAGAVLREGVGGGVVRFVRLTPADAPALAGFLASRAAGEASDVPESLAGRVASYIPPRAPVTE